MELFRLLISSHLIELQSKSDQKSDQWNSVFQKAIGLKQIKVCWAIHSAYSYCTTLEHESGWKISYSGDTEYSLPFIQMGNFFS